MTFWQYYTLNGRNHSAVIGFFNHNTGRHKSGDFFGNEIGIGERHPGRRF